jgi:hypothetical protein
VPFAYVTILRVEGKQTHIQKKKDIIDVGTETASYKVLPLGSNVYSMGSVCFYFSLQATGLELKPLGTPFGTASLSPYI